MNFMESKSFIISFKRVILALKVHFVEKTSSKSSIVAARLNFCFGS